LTGSEFLWLEFSAFRRIADKKRGAGRGRALGEHPVAGRQPIARFAAVLGERSERAAPVGKIGFRAMAYFRTGLREEMPRFCNRRAAAFFPTRRETARPISCGAFATSNSGYRGKPLGGLEKPELDKAQRLLRRSQGDPDLAVVSPTDGDALATHFARRRRRVTVLAGPQRGLARRARRCGARHHLVPSMCGVSDRCDPFCALEAPNARRAGRSVTTAAKRPRPMSAAHSSSGANIELSALGFILCVLALPNCLIAA